MVEGESFNVLFSNSGAFGLNASGFSKCQAQLTRTIAHAVYGKDVGLNAIELQRQLLTWQSRHNAGLTAKERQRQGATRREVICFPPWGSSLSRSRALFFTVIFGYFLMHWAYSCLCI